MSTVAKKHPKNVQRIGRFCSLERPDLEGGNAVDVLAILFTNAVSLDVGGIRSGLSKRAAAEIQTFPDHGADSRITLGFSAAARGFPGEETVPHLN